MGNPVDAKEIKQKIIDSLNSPEAFEEFDSIQKSKVMYVILVNGKRVSMRSGKNVWNGIGPAKSALRNHMCDFSNIFRHNEYKIYDENGKANYHESQKIVKEAEDEWVKNHVVFMPFDKYMAVRRKRK